MAELAKRIRAKYPGAYDDIDDATLEKQVLAKHPEYQDLVEKQPQEPAQAPSMIDAALTDNPMAGPVMRGGQALLRMVKAHPVTAAATVGAGVGSLASGGALAPVLAPWALGMAGAGLGAAGGAGAAIAGRQLATGAPEKAADTLGTMGTEGAAGALGEGGGRLVAAGAAKMAPMVGKAVLRASPTLQREFGDLVPTFLKEGIPVGQSAEAGARMKASAATARQMAADAEAAGAAPVSPREIVKEFRPVRDEIANRAANARPGSDAEMQEVVDRAKGLRLNGPQSVTRNQVLKQSAQSDASNAFRAQDRGATINDVTAKLDKAVAVGRQKAAEARVSGIGDVNKRTQSLMGLEGALETAERKSASPLGFNPVNWASAMAPGLSSHVAFGLDKASRLPMPAALRSAILAALGGLGEDNPPRP